MGDWVYILGGGIVLFWGGAWLLLHLGNFEMRISQLRQGLENRMGVIERQHQAYNRFFADNEKTAQNLFGQLSELNANLEKTREELDAMKRSINMMEISVNDLKLKVNPRNIRYG